MGFLVACIVIGVSCVGGWIAMELEKRRGEREIAQAAAESASRGAARRVEVEAQRVVDAAVRREVDTVIAIAEAITMQAAADANLRHIDDLAQRHPMPKRPAPPPAAPGEPWQLNSPDFPPEGS